MKKALQHILKIRNLRIQVKLGCSTEERAIPQEVLISVGLRFHEAPPGTKSDELDDTVCYAKISENFIRHCEGREFCLVEKLAQDLYEKALEIVGNKAEIALTVHKVRPPVKNLDGGVEFQIGTFL